MRLPRASSGARMRWGSSGPFSLRYGKRGGGVGARWMPREAGGSSIILYVCLPGGCYRMSIRSVTAFE